MPSYKDKRICISFAAVLGTMALFSLFRLVLGWGNASFFASLSGAEWASAFLNGLRFDFAMLALFMGPVLFLLNLPVKKKGWFVLWTSVLGLEFLVFAGLLAADYIYFPKVNRHMAEEIIHLADDWGFIASYAFFQAWPALLGLLLVGVGFGVWVRQLARRYTPRSWSWKKELVCSIVIILAVVLGIRGHLGRSKAIGVADVYNYASSPAGAALTLNGVFTSYQVARKGRMDSQNAFPAQEAVEKAQAYLVASDEEIITPEFPLMRQRRNAAPLFPQRPNILIVLLEGWHPYYVDGLSGNHFGSTPVFDQLIKDGVVFNNAYASGLRSMFGFASVLAGLPLASGLPAFGYGLEMAAVSPTLKHFADAGYYTFFAQTSYRDSYRMCALASYLGAQDSYGWEDLPERLSYNAKAPYGYDYDVFMFAADKIKTRKEPFIGMVFTGITHEPFTSTLPQFDKHPYDSWEHGFLNTLSFADWSIGELLKRAKEDGWFDNTVFIFVADHTSGGPADDSLKNRFRIPFVIYAPKWLKPRQIDYIVSQMDIVPTLYRLAGLNPVYTAFGRDVFDGSVPRVAVVSEGVNLGLITPEGEMRHTGSKILSQAGGPQFNADGQAEKLLLSLDKAAYTLLKENHWYQPNSNGGAQ